MELCLKDENIDQAIEFSFTTIVFAAMTLEAFVNRYAEGFLSKGGKERFAKLGLVQKWIYITSTVSQIEQDRTQNWVQLIERVVKRRDDCVGSTRMPAPRGPQGEIYPDLLEQLVEDSRISVLAINGAAAALDELDSQADAQSEIGAALDNSGLPRVT